MSLWELYVNFGDLLFLEKIMISTSKASVYPKNAGPHRENEQDNKLPPFPSN